jgi:preprotein translocase subunit Sss1
MDTLILEGICIGIVELAFIGYMIYLIHIKSKNKK